MGVNKLFNESEYLLFLLIYASNVRFEFSSKERLSLQNLFPKIFLEVEMKYNGLNEADKLKFLVDGMLNPDFKEYVKSFESSMMKQFWVDGKFCFYEKSFLKFYKELSVAI